MTPHEAPRPLTEHLVRLNIADNCTGCGACVAACPLRALSLVSELAGGLGRKTARVVPALCTGCGACLPVCPRQALTIDTATDP